MIEPPPPPPSHNPTGNSEAGKQAAGSASNSSSASQDAFDLENGATVFIAVLVMLGLLSCTHYLTWFTSDLGFGPCN
jgi:hypothetical protein